MKFEHTVKEIKEPILPQVKAEKLAESLFESISLKKTIKESILDPVNKDLSSDIFINRKMRPDVRSAIKDVFFSWWEELGYKKDQVNAMVMIGSSTGYQYSKTSDVDVNIQVTIADDEVEKIWKLMPNGNNLLKTQHPINYYLKTDDSGIKNADAAYDVLNNTWIKEPKKSNYKAPYLYGLEVAKFFMYGIDGKIAELDRDLQELETYKGYLKDVDIELDKEEVQQMISLKETEIKADLDSLGVAHHMARAFRQEAFADDYDADFLITIDIQGPNESLNNVVYKILEKFGYFDKIAKYDALYDEYNSKKSIS